MTEQSCSTCVYRISDGFDFPWERFECERVFMWLQCINEDTEWWERDEIMRTWEYGWSSFGAKCDWWESEIDTEISNKY